MCSNPALEGSHMIGLRIHANRVAVLWMLVMLLPEIGHGNPPGNNNWGESDPECVEISLTGSNFVYPDCAGKLLPFEIK
jgi:hypothetical protein